MVAVERILQVVYIDPQRASPVSLYLNHVCYEWIWTLTMSGFEPG